MQTNVQDNLLRSYDDALDSLSVMTKQEVCYYHVGDYMNRRRKRGIHETMSSSSSSSLSSSSSCSITTQQTDTETQLLVDPTFRGKMCEWCYRLCDHYGTNREIVAFTLSFVDRFMDQCCYCDRSTFKLLTMTSMYIATKMMNMKSLRIESLVTMCRNEYQTKHFIQMEKLILSGLNFRLNPPIVQAYIVQLCTYMPDMDEIMSSEILSRAIFFAELSLYD